MKNKNLMTLFIAAAIISGCKDDPEPGPSPGNSIIVIVEEDITDPTTWYADSVYLIKAYDFYVENTLTIQAGTVVKFHPSDGPYMVLSGSGTIVARGTASLPIVFTSYKDDVHGGDTNDDGAATQPGRKDWGSINLNGANGSVFKYCQFYYGGKFGYSYTLGVESGSVANIEYCTFAHNAGDDGSGWYGALDCSSAGKGTHVRNNIFYDNIRPLSIMADMSIDNSNIFHDPDDAATTNKYNGIVVETIEETTEANVSWAETEVPFVIDDNDWWIDVGASLRLGKQCCIEV